MRNALKILVLTTLTSGCGTLPLNRSYQPVQLPPPVPPAAPALVIPSSCLETPAERPAPPAEVPPAPNAGVGALEEWKDRVRDGYIDALKVWGALLTDKQVTCKTSLEAQQAK